MSGVRLQAATLAALIRRDMLPGADRVTVMPGGNIQSHLAATGARKGPSGSPASFFKNPCTQLLRMYATRSGLMPSGTARVMVLTFALMSQTAGL